MAKINIPLEDIRDKGGLRILEDAPLNHIVNFYGLRLEVKETFVDPRNDDRHPCEECYFYTHPIHMKGLRQCALFKYCTSPNRKDRTSVVYSPIE